MRTKSTGGINRVRRDANLGATGHLCKCTAGPLVLEKQPIFASGTEQILPVKNLSAAPAASQRGHPDGPRPSWVRAFRLENHIGELRKRTCATVSGLATFLVASSFAKRKKGTLWEPVVGWLQLERISTGHLGGTLPSQQQIGAQCTPPFPTKALEPAF